MTPAGASPRDELLDRAVAWFAANGVGDTSLRTLAAAIGTSHRMLNYHFGSRAGLLGAVVERVELGERARLEGLLDTADDAWSAGERFWQQVADDAQTFTPLYFELAAHAMQAQPYAASLRAWLADGWTPVLTRLWAALGYDAEQAAAVARLNLAVVRGLLFELAITGDREAADAAMLAFGEQFRPIRPA